MAADVDFLEPAQVAGSPSALGNSGCVDGVGGAKGLQLRHEREVENAWDSFKSSSRSLHGLQKAVKQGHLNYGRPIDVIAVISEKHPKTQTIIQQTKRLANEGEIRIEDQRRTPRVFPSTKSRKWPASLGSRVSHEE